MYNIVNTSSLDDILLEYSKRKNKGAYLIRSFSYGKDIESFLRKVVEDRRKYNILFIDKLNNPDEKQLDYYESVLGTEFSYTKEFYKRVFSKWLVRLTPLQRNTLIESLEETFDILLKSGKTESILKNIFVKFMCWFYYKLESILSNLGNDNFPKIIYTGNISYHELLLMHLLAESGCDILLLIRDKESYKKADINDSFSFIYEENSKLQYPEGFSANYILTKLVNNSISDIRKNNNISNNQTSNKINNADKMENTSNSGFIVMPNVPDINTNTWLYQTIESSKNLAATPLEVLNSFLKSEGERGGGNTIYNLFIRINGIWDKTTYIRDLFAWQKRLSQAGRKIIEVNKISIPSTKETNNIPRFNISSKMDIVSGIYPVIKKTSVPRLNHIIYKAFHDIIMQDDEDKLNRLNNKAIYIAVWFNRFVNDFYMNYKDDDNMPVFIYFGGAKSNFESIFLKFLSKILCDVLILCPSKNDTCMLDDKNLFSISYDDYADIKELPKTPDDAVIGTVAYHAEQEITDILYNNSGLYRQRQYKHADTIKLCTMLEEINILWNEPANIRPGFDTIDNTVLLPVIAAKINGVKDNDKKQYFENIRKKLGDDTFLIKSVPYIKKLRNNYKANMLIRNNKLLIDNIMAMPDSPYQILRPETQKYIYSKIQLFLDSKIIKNKYNDLDNKILNVLLNLDTNIIRLIQKFDFTKYIPKIVILAFNEKYCSLEDAILFAFLHFVGFDIVIYAPTGYQVLENYYNEPLFVDYQAGEYKYDMEADSVDSSSLFSWIFRRN